MTIDPVPGGPDDVRVLRASGELDVVTWQEEVGGVPSLVPPDRPLVLDLTDVTFFDSAGVRMLDALARESAKYGQSFRVVAPPASRSRRVLDLVGLGDGLACDDLATALGQVRGA